MQSSVSVPRVSAGLVVTVLVKVLLVALLACALTHLSWDRFADKAMGVRAGNAGDLYDRLAWFDDACHLVNWALLSGAIGLALIRSALPTPALAGLIVGAGATAALLWELAEFLTFLTGTPEISTAYAHATRSRRSGGVPTMVSGYQQAGGCGWPSSSTTPSSGPGLDFVEHDGHIDSSHYAFLISEDPNGHNLEIITRPYGGGE